jgi:hypothetical protein
MGSRLSRLLILAACSTSLMGCILRDFDYQEPVNVPPAVLPMEDLSGQRIRIIDLDTPLAGDAGIGWDLTFSATIRDPNVQQPLTGLIYLDRNPNAPGRQGLIDDRTIPVQQGDHPWDRTFTFELPSEQLAEQDVGCHWVELVVTSTSNISGIADPRLLDPSDVGVGVWWVAAINTGTGKLVVGTDECPN